MSKNSKIWLGVLTFSPILLMIIFFIGYFSFIFKMVGQAQDNPEFTNDDPSLFFSQFIIYFAALFIAIIVSLIVKIYYIVHAAKNKEFDSNQRVLWILLLVFVGGIGSIIYYFMQILPDNKKEELN